MLLRVPVLCGPIAQLVEKRYLHRNGDILPSVVLDLVAEGHVVGQVGVVVIRGVASRNADRREQRPFAYGMFETALLEAQFRHASGGMEPLCIDEQFLCTFSGNIFDHFDPGVDRERIFQRIVHDVFQLVPCRGQCVLAVDYGCIVGGDLSFDKRYIGAASQSQLLQLLCTEQILSALLELFLCDLYISHVKHDIEVVLHHR